MIKGEIDYRVGVWGEGESNDALGHDEAHRMETSASGGEIDSTLFEAKAVASLIREEGRTVPEDIRLLQGFDALPRVIQEHLYECFCQTLRTTDLCSADIRRDLVRYRIGEILSEYYTTKAMIELVSGRCVDASTPTHAQP